MELQALYRELYSIKPIEQPKTEQNIQRAEQPAEEAAAKSEEWITLKEAARRAAVHPQTIRRYMREGLVPYHQARKGCAILINWRAFQAALTKA